MPSVTASAPAAMISVQIASVMPVPPGGILAIDHDAIECPAGPQVRQFGRNRGPTRPTHDVADEEKSHHADPNVMRPCSVMTASSRWSCGSVGTLSTSWIEKATPTATTVFCRRNASSELS